MQSLSMVLLFLIFLFCSLVTTAKTHNSPNRTNSNRSERPLHSSDGSDRDLIRTTDHSGDARRMDEIYRSLSDKDGGNGGRESRVENIDETMQNINRKREYLRDVLRVQGGFFADDMLRNELDAIALQGDMGERTRRDVVTEEIATDGNNTGSTANPRNTSWVDTEDFVPEYDYYENMTYDDLLHDIQQHIFPTVPEWISIVCHFIVFLIGLIGNALVCIAVYRNHTMRTVTNYFIVNLAVADFMVILFCLPFSVVWDVTETWFLGEIMCKGVVYIQTVSVTVSVLTLTFISIDRWYAICYPLKFKSTTGRAKTAIAIIWIIALAFGSPELIVLNIITRLRAERFKNKYLMQCGPNWSAESDLVWSVSKVILLYALPLTLMSVAYCQIVRVLWHTGNVPVTRNHSLDVCGNRRAHTFSMNTNSSTEGQLRSRRKAAKMLVAVVVMFAVCYFPVHLFSILRLVMYLPSRDIVSVAGQVAHWLCYANSAVNPVIYNFMSGKFRKEFRNAFACCYGPVAAATNSRRVTRTSTYICRMTTTAHSNGPRTECIPLSEVHRKESLHNSNKLHH